MTMKIGYIGLGSLGRHLAGSLLGAGFPLTVYDVDASCSVDLGKAGAMCADSIAETAAASTPSSRVCRHPSWSLT